MASKQTLDTSQRGLEIEFSHKDNSWSKEMVVYEPLSKTWCSEGSDSLLAEVCHQRALLYKIRSNIQEADCFKLHSNIKTAKGNLSVE